MKIGVFCEVGWSVHRVFLGVSKQFPEHTFDFLNWSCFTYERLMEFINNSDVIITTSLVSVCGFSNLKDFPIEKVLFVCHGAGEIAEKQLPSGFIYGITSHHLSRLIPNNVYFFTPNGVDHTLFEYKERNGTINQVGWCGATSGGTKQVDWAIEITKHTHINLDICSNVPCNENPSLWQPLPFENVIEWYKTIDMLLITSIPKDWGETGPLPAFEAIVCGIPVIGTPVGNFASVPGPKFTTIEEGIDIINKLKENPEEVRNIAKQQYEYVMKNCTYESTAHLWKKAIDYVYLNGKNGI